MFVGFSLKGKGPRYILLYSIQVIDLCGELIDRIREQTGTERVGKSGTNKK